MKSVSSNLAKLKSNVEWAVLPLSDRTGWTRVRFGDVVENCAETCDPQGTELEQFITLSRGVCPRFLVIARSTIDSAAPKGQKEIAQGRAKRRPGYIWPIPIWRQMRMYRQIGPVALTLQGNYPSDIQVYSTSAGAAPALASFSSCQSW